MELKKIIFFCICVFILNSQKISIGLTPKYSKQKQIERFKEIVAYLEKQLNRSIEIKYASSNDDFLKHYVKGEYDITFSSSVLFVQVRLQDSHIVPLAIIQNRGQTFYRTVFISIKESGLSTLGDLTNKKIVFGNELSTSRYLIPNYILQKNKIECIKVIDSNVKSAYEKLNKGEVDALVDFKAVSFSDKYKVINESFRIPEYLFSVNTLKLDEKEIERIRDVLVQMPLKYIKQLRESYTGLTGIKLKSFNHMIDMAKYYSKHNEK